MMRARIMSSKPLDQKASLAGPRTRRVCTALLLAGFWLAAPVSTAAPQGDKSIKQSEEDLQRVKGRIEAINRKIQRDRGEKDELTKGLEAAERKLSDSQAQLRRVRQEIDAQNARILDTQTRQSEARYRLNEQKESLSLQLRAAFVMGSRSRTQLWLSQEEVSRTGRVLTDYDYLSKARARQIDAVRSEVEQIAALQAQLIDERARLEALELEQTQALESLQSSRKQRQASIAAIDERISSSQGELKQAQADEAALDKLLKSLRDALSDIPIDLEASGKPFAQQKGRLPPPVKGPILADYGSAKADARLTWSGRWIGAREGTPVRAIARGRVAYTGWLQRYGQILILEHDGGFFTLYGHCASVTPGAGEWVEAGQAIGTAGNSGGHDKSGVYLEIRKGATALNPRDWLAK